MINTGKLLTPPNAPDLFNNVKRTPKSKDSGSHIDNVCHEELKPEHTIAHEFTICIYTHAITKSRNLRTPGIM
ncbi:MAG: hypothetical protein B2I17_06115 [Thermoplasmatales archaeon B_DKE]|nr:MAG: hypothetical protein B2I17_06115 [Thermoplasmatales archaeon B_DKE]QRF75746.1 hypothetical protein Thermo_01252 [Thermoplasmatales archaeon]